MAVRGRPSTAAMSVISSASNFLTRLLSHDRSAADTLAADQLAELLLVEARSLAEEGHVVGDELRHRHMALGEPCSAFC